MIRIWYRRISQAWHREFRRQGFDVLNSFSLHFQAKQKRYKIKKMKKEFGEYTKPEKQPIVVNKIEDIPNLEYVRNKVKEAIEKVEKIHGPLKFELTESKDGNPLNATVDVNDEGYKALWLELLKDPDDAIKITQVLQTAFTLGLDLLKSEESKQSETKDTQLQDKSPKTLDNMISPEEKVNIDKCLDEMEKVLISFDMRRVDVGLIINRPPIFLQ